MKKRPSIWNDSRGGVLIMTATSILVLIAIAGASVDFGRWALVKLRTQQAADAAALAVAIMPLKDPTTGITYSDDDRKNTVARYFALNYPEDYLGVSINPQTVANSASIHGPFRAPVTNITMPTLFIQFVGITSLPINVNNEISAQNAASTANYDILFILDNSLSMSRNDVGSGHTADSLTPGTAESKARTECNRYNDSVTDYRAYISGFPALDFDTDLCGPPLAPPLDYIGFDAGPSNSAYKPAGFGLTGATRLNALRYAAQTFATNLLNSNPTSQVGAVRWSDGVIEPSLPLTSDLSTVTNFLHSMYAFGATNSREGFIKAQDLATAFTPGNTHAIVYITDGVNTVFDSKSQYYDTGTNLILDSQGCSGKPTDICRPTNNATKTICKSLKDNNTQIYVIAFGSDIGSLTDPTQIEARAFLQECASKDALGNPLFYTADTADELSAKFDTILTSVKKIKIVK